MLDWESLIQRQTNGLGNRENITIKINLIQKHFNSSSNSQERYTLLYYHIYYNDFWDNDVPAIRMCSTQNWLRKKKDNYIFIYYNNKNVISGLLFRPIKIVERYENNFTLHSNNCTYSGATIL